MRNIIIGTAGHVDHGKTELIKAITGIDTDRLKEEKSRGITIDLGFAHVTLQDQIMCGIVDVPGHERYVKNMLAGAGGIDIALLVIAADEGVMPQTIEHLKILEYLGVKKGIIVISKIDKVEAEWISLVEQDILELTTGTFLEQAPSCKVSAYNKEGIDNLLTCIATMATTIPLPSEHTAFRMWIDRKFIVKGHGVVVTGSVLSGQICVGDTAILYPEEQEVKIRAIECYHQQVACAGPRQRAAMNITGDTASITRGHFLSDKKSALVADVWDAHISGLTTIKKGLRVRIHMGTGEFLARIYPYAAQSQLVKVKFEQLVAACCGDQGMLRRYSPQNLLGGITLLAPLKGKSDVHRRSNWMAAVLNKDEQEMMYGLMLDERFVDENKVAHFFAYWDKNDIKKAMDSLVAAERVLKISSYYVTAEGLKRLQQQAAVLLEEAAVTDQQGLTMESFRRKLVLEMEWMLPLLKYWQQQGCVMVAGQRVFLYSHYQHSYLQYQKILEQLFASLPSEVVNLDVELFVDKLQLPIDQATTLHKKMMGMGLLVGINGIFMMPATLERIMRMIKEYFAVHESLTVSTAKEMFGCSRKMMLAILEHLDQQKITRRVNDVRCVGSVDKRIN